MQGNNMKKLCIDLCAGLKGFSQAFDKAEDWEVVTIEINKKQKPTIQADVRYLPLRKNLKPDCLLASPPCQRFSIAMPKWPKMGIKKAMEVVGACFEAVAWLKPKYWLVENPKGRLRWFLGTPKQTIRYSDYDLNYPTKKLTDFWGTIPLPMVKYVRDHKIGHVEKGWFKKGFDYDVPRDRANRSKIPAGVSAAVLEGVEQQISIGGKQT